MYYLDFEIFFASRVKLIMQREISGMAMHHIYSPHKRQCIVEFASAMDLTGVYLFGKPGRVVVEGLSVNIRKYETKMRRLRWSNMKVMGRLRPEVPASRIFVGFEEMLSLEELHRTLDEKGLGDLRSALESNFGSSRSL